MKLRPPGRQIAAKIPGSRHNQDKLFAEAANRGRSKEGIMAGRSECCNCEPTLDELLDDEMMAPVLRSAGFDAQGFREMIVETARRIDDCRIDNRPIRSRERDDR
jgi:hypothetical protein